MRRILLVEDDPLLLNIYQDLIDSQLSCQIDACKDALDGYSLASTWKYDLIITDHEMPYLNGLIFLKALQEKNTLNRKTPAIILTGHDFNHLKMAKSSHISFIQKPPNFENFLGLIQSCIAPTDTPTHHQL